jgi:DNA-directed RNA polymerase subunit beta
MNSNFYLPDFIEIQRMSFASLLKKGINHELKNFGPIKSPRGDFEIKFNSPIKFSNPKESVYHAIFHKKTYSLRLHINAEFIYKGALVKEVTKLKVPKNSKLVKIRYEKLNHKLFRKEISIQGRIYLGYLPLMTNSGHFIINGSPRVIINQLVRNPGIYYSIKFERKRDGTNIKTYTASFIANQGSWLRFERDKRELFWARINNLKKIPLLLFLKGIGINNYLLTKKLTNHIPIHSSSLTFTNFLSLTTKKSLIEIYSIIKPDRVPTINIARKFIEQTLFDQTFYNLGESGRLQINRKLKLCKPNKKNSITTTRLRVQDILASIEYLLNLIYRANGNFDDVDDLKNRRVRTAGELIQVQIQIGLKLFGQQLQEKVRDQKYAHLSPKILRYSQPFSQPLRTFFGTSQLSQYMDQTNPLAELTHKRRLTCLGPGGLVLSHCKNN